jgi:lactoylglutathione lyase
MARAVGINHVAVEVGTIDEALAFFEQIFGELRLRGRGRQMAFIDLGDQFIALDAEETLRRARDAGAEMSGRNDFRDPWGNHWQIVGYGAVQFTKTPRILDGMGLSDLAKSEEAIAELRAKGLAD